MVSYKPIQTQSFVDNTYKVTDDVDYWNRMKELAVFQEPGIISSVNFSPEKPYHLATTNSNRSALFDVGISQPIWLQSRFRSNVFGLKFRNDGQLLGMGSVDGYLHFFDVSKKGVPSRHSVRVFKAHQSEVRCVAFKSKTTHCASFGDDGQFKVWDLALSKADEPVYSVSNAHSDKIRSCASSVRNSDFFVSGSYDHTVKIWDTKCKPNDACQLTFNHGAPVESLLLTNNNRIVVSAGGNVVKFWDLTVGGKLMHTLENHNRTVTSMAFTNDKKFLLTGGLDRKIHVFRVDRGQFQLINTFNTAAPVLCLDLAKSNDCMAFGMNNLLSIHRREPIEKLTTVKGVAVGTGKELKPKAIIVQKEGVNDAFRGDITAKHFEQIHLGRLDILLRGSQFRKVVDQVFQNKKMRDEKPELVVAALQQLRIRGVLGTALAGRQGNQLKQILSFVCTHFFKPQFFDVLYDVANVLFEIYVEEDLSKSELSAMRDLRNQIRAEIACQQSMLKCWGVLESLLLTSGRSDAENSESEDVFGEMIIKPKVFTLNGDDQTLTTIT